MIFSLAMIQAERSEKTVYYVSPQGSDNNTGMSIEKPFATIGKAREIIRATRQAGQLLSPVTVYLRGGTYDLSESFVLTAEDSGTEKCPITYCAYKNEKPVISGGKEIKGQWKPYKSGIMVCDIPEAREEKWKFRQLFMNGKRLDRARIPDKDNYYKIEKSSQDIGRTAMKYKEGDFEKWNNLEEAEVVIFHSWNDSRLFVSAIDEKERIVTFTGRIGPRLGQSTEQVENRYYIENILEGLDQPGEWYLDSREGKLYLYPADDLSVSEIRAPVINQLLILQGESADKPNVGYISFKGITFSDCEYFIPKEGIPSLPDVGDLYKPSAITLENTRFCTFENNIIRNVGTYALEISGDGNTITRNEIFHTGSGGIITRSYGKERNVISYNHIHDCGELFYSGVGINIDDGGGQIDHNLIYNISQTGIYARHWGTKSQKEERRNQEQGLVIEFNEIHDVGSKINDCAGIFVRDSNIIIRNNLIYNVHSFKYYENLGNLNNCGVPGWGIYLGCETRNSLVENNVIYNTTEGMHVFYGTRNINIKNNIFINSEIRQVRFETVKGKELTNNRVVGNIFYSDLPYAELFFIDSREKAFPAESDNNIIYHAGRKSPIVRYMSKEKINSWQDWLERGYEKNSVIADPLFVNTKAHDYTLQPDSPALKLGFKQIDLSNVGLRGSTMSH